MSDALRGVGVLVTRPRAQAGVLCAALRARGARVVLLPTIAIAPTEPASLSVAAKAALRRADRLVFVSPSAVDAGVAAMAALGIAPARRIAAVGHGSASALARHGLSATEVPAHGSGAQALLQCPGMQRIAGKRVAILRGEGGGDALGRALRERGADVSEVALYRRVRPSVDATEAQSGWQAGWLRVTIVTSGTGLEHLLEIAGGQREALLQTHLVVVSERVAELGRRRGFQAPITVAADPAAPGLVKAAARAAATNRKQA